MSHNVKVKQKVYGTDGDSHEGKDWCAADMQIEGKGGHYEEKSERKKRKSDEPVYGMTADA